MVAMYSEDWQAHMEPIAVKICLPAISEMVIKFVLCTLLHSQNDQTRARGLTVCSSLVHYLPKVWPVELPRLYRLTDQEDYGHNMQ